jgi:hypothetical protein
VKNRLTLFLSGHTQAGREYDLALVAENSDHAAEGNSFRLEWQPPAEDNQPPPHPERANPQPQPPRAAAQAVGM